MIKKGTQLKHGAYSIITRTRDQLQGNRKIRGYLKDLRSRLIQDVAGTEEKLTAAQEIIIERIVAKVGTLRLIECYVANQGIMAQGQLHPILDRNYISWSNSLRQDLQLIGIASRADEILDLGKYVEQFDAKKKDTS